MTTAKAVEILRGQLGDSQRTFAKKLRTTVTTISRYENGRIGISEEMLRKIAALAEDAALTDMHNFFESQRRLAVTARVRNLPSKGTQRRLSLEDLIFTSGHIREAQKILSSAMLRLEQDINEKRVPDKWLLEFFRMALITIGRPLDDVLQPNIGPLSPSQLEEEKKLLLRPPKTTGLQLTTPTKKGKQ